MELADVKDLQELHALAQEQSLTGENPGWRHNWAVIREQVEILISRQSGSVELAPARHATPDVSDLEKRVSDLEAEVVRLSTCLRGGLWNAIVKLWRKEL